MGNTSNTGNKQIKIILDLLQKGEEVVELDTHNDVVLVLGNTGSGKSTFTHFVAGNNSNLESKEVGRGQYIIVDNNNKISDNSTINSKTVFPEVVVNAKTNTVFYDCPGFSNTIDAAHDISTTYFIKKITESVNAVKLIFIVSYHSVQYGVDGQDFMLLLKHITNMVKDIEKFKDSIALVITKVGNTAIRQGNNYILMADETIIEDIAHFLKGVRQELITKIGFVDISLHQQHFYKNGIKLIDAILTQRGQEYTKIGIFRRPDKSGALSQVTLLQNRKRFLENIIYKNVHLTVYEEEDFSYTISSDSRVHVNSLVEEIHKSITSDIANMGQEIIEFYHAQEEQSYDIDKLYPKFKAGYDMFSEIQKTITEFAEPPEFIKQIITNLNNLNINISSKNLLSVLNYHRFLKFVSTLSDEETSRPIEWAQGLTHIIEYLNNSEKWYSLLKHLFVMLSKYDIQQNVKKFNTTLLKAQINPKGVKITKINFFKLLDHFNKQTEYDIEYRNTEDIKVDEFKLKALERILDFTLNPGVKSSCMSNKLVIRGHYVKISDVVDKKCPEKIEFIDIFALSKVFIDTNLNKTGDKVHLSIIAPTWDIIGCQKIILDGKPGEAHVQVKAGGDDKDGKPGLPGGSAGIFFGIGQEFINGEYLSIYAKGGKGGPGQQGADGARGTDGHVPNFAPNRECTLRERRFGPEPDAHLVSWKAAGFSSKEITHWIGPCCSNYFFEYHIYGKNCTDGENGCNGGVGGKGGNSGNILIVKGNTDLKISINNSQGETGAAGVGGNGGIGTTQMLVYILEYCKHSSFLKPYRNCSSSKPGITGQNRAGIQEPEAAVILVNPSHTVNDYKHYLRENLSGSLRESFLMEFLDQLQNNQTVKELYDTFGFINELQGLENQYYKLYRKMSFLPFYKSLLHRLSQYTDNPKDHERSIEYKKAITYTYTAILSKICNINNNLENNLVIDLSAYLDLVINNINGLKDLKNAEAMRAAMSIKQITIKRYQEKQDAMNAKISEVEHFIDTHITSELNNIVSQMDIQIQLLIDAVITVLDKIKNNKKELREKKKELERALVVRKLIGIVKIASQFQSFLGSMGAVTGAAVGGEVVILDDTSEHDTDRMVASLNGVRNSITTITDELAKKLQVFYITLDDVEQELKKFKQSSNNILDIKQKILITKKSIQFQITQGPILASASLDKIRTLRKEVVPLLQNEKKALKKQEPHNDQRIREQLIVVNHVLNILSISEMSMNLYSRIRNQSKIDKLGVVIKIEEMRITQLEQYEENIYKIIIPLYKDIKNRITLEKKLDISKPNAALYLSKWQIQSAVKDAKVQIQKMTKGLNIHKDLTRCMDKIQEGMSIIIQVYNRIDDYRDRTESLAFDPGANFTDRILALPNAVTNSVMKILHQLKYRQQVFEIHTNQGGKKATRKQKICRSRRYKKKFYKAIIDMCRDMENKVTAAVKKSKSKTYIALGINKWQIQNVIKHMKFQMQEMAKRFNVQDDLNHYTENLVEGMSIMVNVYDHIQDYHYNAEFVAYIADITSSHAMEIKVENLELNNIINDLTLIIQSNVILGQYERAMNAFKQYVFPFTHYYLKEFNLPSVLKLNDNSTDDLAANAVTQIEHIKSKISNSAKLFKQFANHIRVDVLFSNQQPFFIWRHDTNKATISKLLEGQEVTIKADITKGIKKNAVKFNVIYIRFQLANETMQKELDKQLENFEVSMTHLGKSYYRCGNQVYTITGHKQVIVYSLEYSSITKEPLHTNKVYDKLKHKDSILSPYTTWNMKLTNVSGSFDKLSKYRNEVIDLHLEGRGQYLDIDVCDDNLENYYKVHDAIPEMNTINVYNQEDSIISRHHDRSYKESYHRRRRGIMNEPDFLAEHIDKDSFATSGTSSIFKSSYINKIINLISNSFVTLAYLIPVYKTTKDEKSDVQDIIDNSSIQMKLINIQPLRVESSDISNWFVDKDSSMKERIDYTLLSKESNLLLLDVLIRKKNGVKYNKNVTMNYITVNEYAHNLAYNAYAPKDKIPYSNRPCC